MTIRHLETKAVFSLWSDMRNGAKAPNRAAIEPRSFARHLSQICLLEKSGPDARIRLGGTDICALFGKELRGAEFGSLFTRGARLSVQAALARALTLSQPMLVEALGETADGRQIGVEVLLLPLLDAQGLTTQVLVYVQPLDPVARLVGQPLTGFRFLGMSEARMDQADWDDNHPPRKATHFVPPLVARPQLRLVVSNPLTAAAQFLRPERPVGAFHVVT